MNRRRRGVPIYATCVHVLAGAPITFHLSPGEAADHGEALCLACEDHESFADVRIVCASCIATILPRQRVQ